MESGQLSKYSGKKKKLALNKASNQLVRPTWTNFKLMGS